MKDKLAERYRRGWVTDEQLRRYVALGVISDEDVAEITAVSDSDLG